MSRLAVARPLVALIVLLGLGGAWMPAAYAIEQPTWQLDDSSGEVVEELAASVESGSEEVDRVRSSIERCANTTMCGAGVGVCQPEFARPPPAGNSTCSYDTPANVSVLAAERSQVRRVSVASDGGCVAPQGAGTAIRQVGRHLESVDDVFANPQLLAGEGPGRVSSILGDTPGWVQGGMRQSTSAPGSGWTFRELNRAGTDFTDRYVQWHPGSRHHFGGQPYWKVSSGSGGTERIPQ